MTCRTFSELEPSYRMKRVTQTPLKMLSLNFPSLDESTLEDVLNQSNGNYALAIRALN